MVRGGWGEIVGGNYWWEEMVGGNCGWGGDGEGGNCGWEEMGGGDEEEMVGVGEEEMVRGGWGRDGNGGMWGKEIHMVGATWHCSDLQECYPDVNAGVEPGVHTQHGSKLYAIGLSSTSVSSLHNAVVHIYPTDRNAHRKGEDPAYPLPYRWRFRSVCDPCTEENLVVNNAIMLSFLIGMSFLICFIVLWKVKWF